MRRFFPPGDLSSLANSRWAEFIETRDTVLRCLAMALSVLAFLQSGKLLRKRFVGRHRYRIHDRTRWPSIIAIIS